MGLSTTRWDLQDVEKYEQKSVDNKIYIYPVTKVSYTEVQNCHNSIHFKVLVIFLARVKSLCYLNCNSTLKTMYSSLQFCMTLASSVVLPLQSQDGLFLDLTNPDNKMVWIILYLAANY